MVLFPEAEAVCSIGLHEIVEWAYEHRQIPYKPVNLEDPNDENVGKQLYHFIVSCFS
jgi:hypothetical protein